MGDDAVSRLAASITQLTLCQVSTDKIDAAIKLLDKACQKLRGILDVPPQRIIDLKAFVLVPIGFLRPRRGLGQASPSLEAPRLQALDSFISILERERLSSRRQARKRGFFWARF